jgi:broad specificity phosphatase PhoE
MRLIPLLVCECLVLFAVAGCTRRPVPETTVILVRHAERGNEGRDPALTPDGERRAAALLDAIGRSGLDAVYVTNFNRTQQTAAPTAAELGITPTVVTVAGSAQAHADGIAASIRENHAGKRVLVVGHSNTVPLIIQSLGVTAVRPIEEDDYGRLFIVTLRKHEPPRLIEARYGE